MFEMGEWDRKREIKVILSVIHLSAHNFDLARHSVYNNNRKPTTVTHKYTVIPFNHVVTFNISYVTYTIFKGCESFGH